MDIQIAVLCDAATDNSGKLNILGTFDTSQLPAIHPQCSIAIRMTFNKVEEGARRVKLNFVDEDGKSVMQPILEVEMAECRQAGRHECNDQRLGYRSGHCRRRLITRVGTLVLRVPQNRAGHFSTQVFEQYQRNGKAFVTALATMWLRAVRALRLAAHASLPLVAVCLEPSHPAQNRFRRTCSHWHPAHSPGASQGILRRSLPPSRRPPIGPGRPARQKRQTCPLVHKSPQVSPSCFANCKKVLL